MKTLVTSIVVLFLQIFIAFAAPKDSTSTKLVHPNIIKLNLSSMVVYSPACVLSYERIVSHHQSFAVTAGYITFPQLLRDLPSNISVNDTKSKSGYRIGADYRFYFKNENKYDVPRGLYWGPFVDYFHFTNSRSITALDTSFASGSLDFVGKLNIGSVGVNLGYQFVIKQRLSIDLVLFGPALAYYGASLDLKGDFDANEEAPYLQELYDYMINNFPIIGQLATEKTISSSGRADLFFAGFRYSISAGFRF